VRATDRSIFQSEAAKLAGVAVCTGSGLWLNHCRLADKAAQQVRLSSLCSACLLHSDRL